MNLLLDTHAFIWALSSPDKLSLRVRTLFSDGRTRWYLSSASIWEIFLKHSSQKKNFIFPEEAVLTGIKNLGCEILGVEARHALTLFRLPIIHRDPFDRMLLAQAWTDNLVLVTADRQLSKYSDIQTLW